MPNLIIFLQVVVLKTSKYPKQILNAAFRFFLLLAVNANDLHDVKSVVFNSGQSSVFGAMQEKKYN